MRNLRIYSGTKDLLSQEWKLRCSYGSLTVRYTLFHVGFYFLGLVQEFICEVVNSSWNAIDIERLNQGGHVEQYDDLRKFIYATARRPIPMSPTTQAVPGQHYQPHTVNQPLHTQHRPSPLSIPMPPHGQTSGTHLYSHLLRGCDGFSLSYRSFNLQRQPILHRYRAIDFCLGMQR